MKLPGISLALLTLILASVAATGAEPKLTALEVVQRHVDSIGTKQARDAAKARNLKGTVQLQKKTDGESVMSDGAAAFTSEGNKTHLTLNFGVASYDRDDVAFDGRKVVLAAIRQGARSEIDSFISEFPFIAEDGLLGGTLSTAWALANLHAHGAKISYDGIEKLGTRELLRVTYFPKKYAAGLSVKLYFEPDTFRHVETIYMLDRSLGRDVGMEHSLIVKGSDLTAAMASIQNQAIANSTSGPSDRPKGFFTLVEIFGKFQTVNGVTIPSSYTIIYTARTDPTRSGDWRWDVTWKQYDDGSTKPTSQAQN